MPEPAVKLPNNLNEAPESEFCGMVPRELLERFKKEMPYYGVNKWFIQFAMEAFLEELETTPDLRDQVARAIKNSLKRGSKE